MEIEEVRIKDQGERQSLAFDVLGELCAGDGRRLTINLERDDFVIEGALSDAERQAIDKCRDSFEIAARSILSSNAECQIKLQRINRLGASANSKNLEAERLMLDLKTRTAGVTFFVPQALKFRSLWDAIPEDQRSPAVQSAHAVASSLSLEDLPPGFQMPGTSGRDR